MSTKDPYQCVLQLIKYFRKRLTAGFLQGMENRGVKPKVLLVKQSLSLSNSINKVNFFLIQYSSVFYTVIVAHLYQGCQFQTPLYTDTH